MANFFLTFQTIDGTDPDGGLVGGGTALVRGPAPAHTPSAHIHRRRCHSPRLRYAPAQVVIGSIALVSSMCVGLRNTSCNPCEGCEKSRFHTTRRQQGPSGTELSTMSPMGRGVYSVTPPADAGRPTQCAAPLLANTVRKGAAHCVFSAFKVSTIAHFDCAAPTIGARRSISLAGEKAKDTTW